MKENVLTTNFEPHEGVIFAQTTEIGTHENKAIHSILYTTLNSPSLIFALETSDTDLYGLEFAHSSIFLHNPLCLIQLAQF